VLVRARGKGSAYLDSFVTLGFDVAAIDAGTHVFHDDGSGAAVYEDAGGM
jgi:hypothetical protein